VYVWGAAWRHCDSGNQAYMCRGRPRTFALACYL